MGVEPTSCSLKTNCSKPIKLQHHFTKINQLPILYTNFLFSSNEIYGAPCRNRTGVACLEGRNMAILSRVPNQLALSEGLEPTCIQLAFSCLEDRRHTTAFIQRTLLIYSSNFSKSTLFFKKYRVYNELLDQLYLMFQLLSNHQRFHVTYPTLHPPLPPTLQPTLHPSLQLTLHPPLHSPLHPSLQPPLHPSLYLKFLKS